MAIRTTATAVRKIIEINEDLIKRDSDIDPFIEWASSVVDDVLEGNSKGIVYTEAKLELCERWLAAHAYCVLDPRKEEEIIGDAEIKYEGKTQMHLERTRYGQYAMGVDTHGLLAEWNSSLQKGKITVGLTWLGTEYC